MGGERDADRELVCGGQQDGIDIGGLDCIDVDTILVHRDRDDL
jgi:hypothetical protein